MLFALRRLGRRLRALDDLGFKERARTRHLLRELAFFLHDPLLAQPEDTLGDPKKHRKSTLLEFVPSR